MVAKLMPPLAVLAAFALVGADADGAGVFAAGACVGCEGLALMQTAGLLDVTDEVEQGGNLTGGAFAFDAGDTVEIFAGGGHSCGEACDFIGGVCTAAAFGSATPGPANTSLELCAANATSVVRCSCCLRLQGLGTLDDVGNPPPGLQTWEERLLRESPFLMTHDSATGYVGRTEAPFVKTQWGSLVDQLDCGARAFDLRLVVTGDDFGDIRFHHVQITVGEVAVGWVSRDQTLSSTLPGVVDWAYAHPDEFVLLSVSHCYQRYPRPVADRWVSVNCTHPNFVKVFYDLGVRFQTSCTWLEGVSLVAAKERAKMSGGGHLLAIPGEDGCIEANFDPSVTDIRRLRPYVEATMNEAPSMGQLFQVQSLLQQSGARVPIDFHVNIDVLFWLANSDLYSGVNLLEINNVCAFGTLISKLLGARVSDMDSQRCRARCITACSDAGVCWLASGGP